MYRVQMYEQVRRAVLINNISKREVARIYGINRRTVSKMCKHPMPPGYTRKQKHRYPKLGGHIATIDQILSSDLEMPPKQRHTSQRIYERLKEVGYDGSYDSVRRYVVTHKKVRKEVYIPLNHQYGTAQCDFGECIGSIGGNEVKLHYFVMTLCKSNDTFVKAYFTEDQISWCDGHASAFEYFNGVPTKILYDNSAVLVKKIGRADSRELTNKFTELKSHYLFEAIFANPGKGHEKGIVENKVGYVRRNFLVPKPQYHNIEELNEYLQKRCLSRRNQKRLSSTIGELLLKEQRAFLSISSCYESCNIALAKVNSYSLVRYKTNDYSVPTEYAYKDVILKVYCNKLKVFYKTRKIAEHERCYGTYEQNYDYLHYLPLLLRKSRALDQAAPLQSLQLSPAFERLRNALEERYEGSKGKREYIKILELLGQHTKSEVNNAIKEAFRIGAISVDSVKQIIHRNKDTEPRAINQAMLVGIPTPTVLLLCLNTTR